MTRSWLLVALAMTLASAAPAGAEPLRALLTGEMSKLSLIEPRKPADIAFQNEAGETLGWQDFRGKVLLVNFWATWCAPCRHEMPSLDRLQAALGGDDFQVLAIAADRGGKAKVKPFLDELGLKALPVYLDPPMRAARAQGAVGLPTTLLLDREGREVARLVGPAEWDSPEAVALIRRLISSPAT